METSEQSSNQNVGQGLFYSSRVADRGKIRLKLPYQASSKGREYRITLFSKDQISDALGVVLYEPVKEQRERAVLNALAGKSEIGTQTMALKIEYAR